MDSIVPPCPVGLCITNHDFLKQDFSVDNFFIEQSVRETALETLRDDLGIYLKVLRSSMIELINEDYADFVNLSTNLVGLDQGIERLKSPLLLLQAEVEAVNESIEATLGEVRVKLELQEKVRGDKARLQNMQHILHSLAKLERVLGNQEQLSMDQAERIAADVNHLDFCVWKMDGAAVVEDVSPRLASLCDVLHGALDASLVRAVRGQDVDCLARCCRIYATIDRIGKAENLVREEIIAPVLEEILVERALEANPHGLKGLLAAVMNVIPEHLGELLKITTDEKKMVEGSVKGFDLLVNSMWPEVVKRINQHLSFIFSAGNPGEFFKNYTTCFSFLDSFEAQLTSEASLHRLRSHDSYAEFMQSWNLPVYFQIRFQEIASPYETVLGEKCLERMDEGDCCKLKATHAAKTAIRTCWNKQVYLPPLAHKFFKLTFQIISRYRTWCLACLENSSLKPLQGTTKSMKKSGTTSNLQVIETKNNKTHKRSVSAENIPETQEQEMTIITLGDLVLIHKDCLHLSTVLPDLLATCTAGPIQGNHQITSAVASTSDQLDATAASVAKVIVESLAAEPVALLKQVTDIPRLYRRTNRETPSKPCNYVVNIVAGLASFTQEHGMGQVIGIIRPVVVNVLDKYIILVRDVLMAVTKMEESLRRLKKVREKGGKGEVGVKVEGFTDDDKIRMQIYLDVEYFCREVGKLGMEELEQVEQIRIVVKEATNVLNV